MSPAVERYVRTLDDWSPNFGPDLVRVRFGQLHPSGLWRVSVWGADDLGMERDFIQQGAAEHCFVAVANEPYLTRKGLEGRSFVYC